MIPKGGDNELVRLNSMFAELDGDGSGDVCMPEWLSYIERQAKKDPEGTSLMLS